MNARERTAEAGGLEFFYREWGDGPPVLLLHGFPETSRCWRHVGPALARARRVIAPDLPGFGRSGFPRAYDAGSLAGTIGAFMDAVGAPRAAVVGHDWGGSLTFRLALDHPARAERIAVVNAPFRVLDLRRGWHIALFNLPVLPEIAFTLAGDRLVEGMLRGAAARKDAYDPETLEEYRGALRGLARQRAAFAYYRTISRSALRRALRPGRRPPRRRIEVPALIVWGLRDPVLPFSLLDGIERDIPRVRIEQIPEAGHFVPEESPERLTSLLEGFLAEPPPP